MRRLQTALFATSMVLASTLAVSGSQAAEGAEAVDQVLPRRASPTQRPAGLGLDRPSSEPASTIPTAADLNTEAARWRATVGRRLASLSDAATEGPVQKPAASAEEIRALELELQRLTSEARDVADVGIAVRELESGAPLFSFHADQALNPASNHKLLTAVAAAELLGAEYRFTTEVRLDGDTLVLVGDGDPSLQVEDLEALAARTIRAGIDLSAITSIAADDTAFTARRFGPGYSSDGPGWSYLAPSGALSLQFNTVTVSVRAAGAGQPARVAVDPPSAHIVVENHATTGRRDRVSVQTFARGDQTVVEVRGTVRSAVRERRRITDPASFTASTFAMALAASSGSAPLPVHRAAASDQAELVTQHDSDPLPEVLSAALVFSNNFTSEQVLRTLGRRMSAEPGSWRNGHVALERFWAAIGRDKRELTFENASGYSRAGRLTADAIVALLALTQRPDGQAKALLPMLPAAGRQGTMRNRLPRARGRVRAKTGTLSGASALSGLVVSRSGGRALGFSILVNGKLTARRSRRLQDRLVMALVHHLD